MASTRRAAAAFRPWPLAALAGLSIAAAATLITLGTRSPGPGLYGDGAAYIGAAESLARGDGLRVPFASYGSADSTAPLAQWPPGFPATLSVPLRAGLSPLSALRLIQVVAGSFTVGVTAMAVGLATAPIWGGLVAVVLLVTPAFVGVHLGAVSEPLYIGCLALMLVAMAWRPDRPLGYGLAAAAAVLVRHVGVAAVVGAGVYAAMRPGPWRDRLRRALLAVLPGLAAREMWNAHVRGEGGALRSMHLDRHVGAAARDLGRATAAWLAPWDGPATLRAIIKLALGAAIAFAIVVAVRAARRADLASDRGTVPASGEDGAPARSGRAGRGPVALRMAGACGILIACHLAALLSARVLYSDVAFYDRMTAPIAYLMDVATVALIATYWGGLAARARVAVVGLGAVWLAGSGAATGDLLRVARTVGLDHANLAERRSPMIAWLRAHANSQAIYTNEPAKIYYHLHRVCRALPWILDADSARMLDDALRRRPGLVVWFASGRADSYVAADLLPRAASPAKLEWSLPLRAVVRLTDGVVWVRDGSASRDVGSPPPSVARGTVSMSPGGLLVGGR